MDIKKSFHIILQTYAYLNLTLSFFVFTCLFHYLHFDWYLCHFSYQDCLKMFYHGAWRGLIFFQTFFCWVHQGTKMILDLCWQHLIRLLPFTYLLLVDSNPLSFFSCLLIQLCLAFAVCLSAGYSSQTDTTLPSPSFLFYDTFLPHPAFFWPHR